MFGRIQQSFLRSGGSFLGQSRTCLGSNVNFFGQVRPTFGLNRNFSSMSDSQKLLGAVADLEKFNIKLKNFPTMVFLGPQSSGKSSVIQAITGDYILPTDMKMATKKPTHITTLKSDFVKYKVGEREFITAKDAASEIDRLNRNDHVEKIDVVVYSPNVHNSVFIDLPGLFAILDNDNGDDFRKIVKNIATAYISNSSYIPIVVHGAPEDAGTNAGIRLVYKSSRRADAFGILTKLDMIRDQDTSYIEKMMNGTEYKMGYGYCAVILSNSKDIKNGLSIQDKIKVEAEYLAKLPNIRPAGVPMLRKMISDIQAKKISEQIPNILAEVDAQIESLKHSQNFFHEMTSGSNKYLGENLSVMIKKLVSSSHTRAAFEADLKKLFKREIVAHLETLNPKESGENSDVKPSKIQTVNNMNKDSRVDPNIISFHQTIKSKNMDFSENKFKELFIYGSSSPVFVDNIILNEAFDQEAALSACLPLIKPFIDDNMGIKRDKWNEQLDDYLSVLLKDEKIHEIIKSNTLSLLIEYICKNTRLDETNKKFVEYIINDIGNNAFESKIKYAITAVLNLEKRPDVDIKEVLRYFVRKHPEILDIPNTLLFTPTVYKTKLEMYTKDWMDAHTNVVIDNMANKSYVNVAVNLLGPLIKEIIIKILDMSYKENADKEKNNVDNKMKKLLEIRQILLAGKFYEESGAPEEQASS